MENAIERNIPTEEIITWHPNGSTKVRMDNILTTDQMLYPGMLLLKTEGLHVDVVRVIEIWEKSGFLYLKIQDNKTGQIQKISQRLGIEYFAWTLISHDYLADEFLFMSDKKGTEIEFDF